MQQTSELSNVAFRLAEIEEAPAARAHVHRNGACRFALHPNLHLMGAAEAIALGRHSMSRGVLRFNLVGLLIFQQMQDGIKNRIAAALELGRSERRIAGIEARLGARHGYSAENQDL